MAWRLGILDAQNSLENIPEDGPRSSRVGKHSVKKLGISFYQKDDEDSNAWQEYQKKENSNSSFQQIDLNALLLSKPRIRYKLLVVLNELVELSPEFFQTQRITLSYNFIGFEQKIQLYSSYALRYGKTIPINRVKLFYFFADSFYNVNEQLRQKDVNY